VQFTGTFEEAQAALGSSRFAAIITEAHLPDGRGWKELLEEIQQMPAPPPLVVADRLADEVMWAEVLNLGGYDLLMKPFDETEVLHVIGNACRSHALKRTC
jgi:two-component system response regulator HydG